MDALEAVRARLRTLRGVFVGWFVVQSAIGNWAALEAIGQLRRSPRFATELEDATTSLVLGSALLSEVLILGAALLVFQRLLRFAGWARIILLVFGWLGALSAALSLLTTPNPAVFETWLDGLVPGLDWRGLMRVSLLTNALALLFWGYLIRTLQFRDDVRAAFPPAA